jgi:hypothetical protein
MSTPEDPTIKALIDPYVALITTYNNTVIGSTAAPFDSTNSYISESNVANLQADSAVNELENIHGIPVDFHLSGAMTQTNPKILFPTASAGAPASLKISDMFTAMPYENSLVVISMNGPQLKAVLERAYRNYYYYKYVPGYGGYSFYTTCMLDINAGGKITYNDLYPQAYDPNKQYVVSLEFGGTRVNFNDASTYYNVSTVNYLAAGSCNFNNDGVSLWPLNQIVQDTQYYVRDAVIDYVTAMGTVSPAVEGRVNFISDSNGPDIVIYQPKAVPYLNSSAFVVNFTATDSVSGIGSVTSTLDGVAVTNGQVIKLYTFAAGTTHNFNITAQDGAYNPSNAAVSFTVETSIESMKAVVTSLYNDGKLMYIAYRPIMNKLQSASNARLPSMKINVLNSTITLIRVQSGRTIDTATANLLMTDLRWLVLHLQ